MQIVGYRAGVEEPARLLLADGDTVEEQRLAAGTELEYALDERHCAGSVDDDSHEPCEVETAPYCDVHTDRWPCARCVGECSLPLESCREEHAIYLAAFSPATFKVGVTRSWRLDRRLREQGADRGAHLRTVKDGRIARQIEAEIAADVGDRVRVPTKIDGLHESVDADAWDALLSEYDHEATFQFEYDLGLDTRPQSATFASGTVRGTKGRVLVLDRAGTTFAVDMRDLVGYEVSRGDTSQELQSSLGAF